MKIRSLFLGVVFAVLAAGCVKDAEVKKPAAPINKVAIVTLSVTNWGGTVTGTSGSNTMAGKLIDSTLATLLAETENKLSGIMHVTKASAFAGSSAYHGLGVKNTLDAFVPKVSGAPMAFFAKDNDELISAGLSQEVAKKLCTTLKVDGVVVVFSEWSHSNGNGFAPLKRALAKDVVSVFDRSGNMVFHKRVDETGSGVLGGPYSPIIVNEGTIKQWAAAYESALDKILVDMKKLRQS